MNLTSALVEHDIFITHAKSERETESAKLHKDSKPILLLFKIWRSRFHPNHATLLNPVSTPLPFVVKEFHGTYVNCVN